MSKKIDAGTAGLYSFKPKSPAPGNGLAAKDLAVSEDLQVSAQATIEDKLDETLAEYFTWKGEAIHEINRTENYKRLKDKLQAIITTETTKASKKQAEEHFMECLASDTCSSLESARNEKREALEKVMAALQKEHQKGDL